MAVACFGTMLVGRAVGVVGSYCIHGWGANGVRSDNDRAGDSTQ